MKCLLCEEPILLKFTVRTLCFWQPIEDFPLCDSCRQGIRPLSSSHCPQCARSQQRALLCADCVKWRHDYDWKFKNYAFYEYRSKYRDWLLLLKGARDQRLAGIFKKDLVRMKRTYPDFVWVPIPSQNERAKQRGFHQTAVILESSGILYRLLLEDTASIKAAGSHRSERLGQLDKFQLRDQNVLPKCVILFDDVYTTGATLYGAYRILKASGVEKIIGVTLAR